MTAVESARTFRLPDLGEGLTSAEVVAWLVAVGDTVTVDQPVVEVETAKASMEVPCPYAGVVTALHGEAGATVAVGAPLISVGTGPAAVGFAEPGTVTPDASAAVAPERSGNVLIGYGTSESTRRPRSTDRVTSGGVTRPDVARSGGTVNRAVISPLVRRLARERGVDLTTVTATGANDTVTRADIERAHSAEPVPLSDGFRRIPLRGARRAMAETLSRSRREIPEATVWVDVDATALVEARRALNAARPDEPVSLLALLARFCVQGLARFPELNARVEDDTVVLLDAVHLGVAAQTERGLVVPVVRNAQALDLRGTSAALRSLTERARDGSLSPVDMTGGTFTLNNYGPFGVDGSAAIINPPEVAIVGIGRIIDRPWVVDGQLAVRKVTELTLAFDHRACDGGAAGGFLRYVADCVENPLLSL